MMNIVFVTRAYDLSVLRAFGTQDATVQRWAERELGALTIGLLPIENLFLMDLFQPSGS